MTGTVAALLIMTSVGCGGGEAEGPPLVPVSGMLLIDGEPIDRALIAMRPRSSGTAATASSEGDGSYTMRTGSREGVEPGEYMITVTKFETASGGGEAAGDGSDDYDPTAVDGPLTEPKNLLPEAYGDPKTAEMKITVEAGKPMTDYKIELTR